MRSRLSPTLRCSHVSMPPGELLADPRAVRVDDLAEQQLGADRQHVTPHRPSMGPRCASRGGRCRDPRSPSSATANHRMMSCERRPFVGGRQQHDADREDLEERLPLPSLRAGSEMPRRPANDRYTETPTSRHGDDQRPRPTRSRRGCRARRSHRGRGTCRRSDRGTRRTGSCRRGGRASRRARRCTEHEPQRHREPRATAGR